MGTISKFCIMLCMVLIVGACGSESPKILENVPLAWTPTSRPDIGTLTLADIANTQIQFEPFEDKRQNPQLIAENREGATPKPVTTKDSVGAYVSIHMRDVFTQVGLLTVGQGGGVIISGEVRQFFVEEVNTYRGNVVLYIKARNRAGKILWEGLVTGTSTRFGRSYSLDNYYEVFSDAVTDASNNLLQSNDFRNAITHNR